MLITQVKLEGFRNFKNATINLTKKSLIIGSNEIGKSNLLHALRILLDRTLSLADVEPQDSDFYVYEDTNEIRNSFS
jgi:putative ATP-dependent endonuclease of OLD family